MNGFRITVWRSTISLFVKWDYNYHYDDDNNDYYCYYYHLPTYLQGCSEDQVRYVHEVFNIMLGTG